MGFMQGILDAFASTTGELTNVFSVAVSPAIFSVLWLPFTTLCGAGIGALISTLDLRISKKVTVKAIADHPNHISNHNSDIGTKPVVSDIVGDTWMDITRSTTDDLTELLGKVGNSVVRAELFSLPLLAATFSSWALCVAFLGTGGAIGFTTSYLVCTFAAPKLEERHFILSRIEEIVRKMHYRPEDTKKISRKFYKTFRSWLKTNRNNDEVFLTANTILEEYTQQLENP